MPWSPSFSSRCCSHWPRASFRPWPIASLPALRRTRLLLSDPLLLGRTRYARMARRIRHLARHRRKLASLAVTRVLEVDPVVRVDALGRDRVAFLQEAHEDAPCPHLLRRRRLGDVGKMAVEPDADRVGPDPRVGGGAVVDILVVVAVRAVAVRRNRVLGGRD